MTGRSRAVLGRFPLHMEATRAGKQLEVVADAVSGDLDVQAVALGRIRRSHRIGEAEELLDVLRIAALHGIGFPELAIAESRFRRARQLGEDLTKAANPDERDTLAAALLGLWGIAEPGPLLPRYLEPGNPDLNVARDRLLAHIAVTVTEDRRINVFRTRIVNIAGIHSRGNGTVRAILDGAANTLDLDLTAIRHSADRYLHSAFARDRITLTRPLIPSPPGSPPTREVSRPFTPAQESVIVEENPLRRYETGQVERRHAERFRVQRQGFERAVLQVRVTGKEALTVGPMVVNRDEGHGVGFSAPVPSGETLVFTEEGRVLLNSDDVTSFAFAWKGACFAGEDERKTDMVFEGPGAPANRPRARFAESFPAGALDSDFVFPHAGDNLPMPGIAVGETRFAVFVQQAHFSSVLPTSPPRLLRVVPRTKIGFLDNSVFAAAEGETGPGAALISLSWLERRAFMARVWIPMRFQSLIPDDAEGSEVKRRVVLALNRFRPAGVQLEVEYLDPRWVMGRGIALNEGSEQPEAPGTGTVLWAAPNE